MVKLGTVTSEFSRKMTSVYKSTFATESHPDDFLGRWLPRPTATCELREGERERERERGRERERERERGRERERERERGREFRFASAEGR
jgi:hypothetical protein